MLDKLSTISKIIRERETKTWNGNGYCATVEGIKTAEDIITKLIEKWRSSDINTTWYAQSYIYWRR